MENNESPAGGLILPDTIQHFIKVPKEVILANTMPEHRISVFLYFNYNQTWDATVHYSPVYMIQWCGYKPNWHRGTGENIYTKFRDCMGWYSGNGYIAGFDEGKYIQATFQSSLLDTEKLNPKNNFGIIYDFEVERINGYGSTYKPLNKSILLLLLAYIRAFTWNRANERGGHPEGPRGRKPEIFYSQFTDIAASIGGSRKMVARATAVLEELALIKTYRMPRHKDPCGQWHTDGVIYACPYRYVPRNSRIVRCPKEEYSYEAELEHGIRLLREQNHASKKFCQE